MSSLQTQESSRPLRWGILSTARINRSLLGPLAGASRSELIGVASRDLAVARDYAEEHRIPRAYGSYQDLLADPDIDVVYISLPNSLHCHWTVAAATAGKHVLCEKPLVLSLDEMDRVEAAAAASRVTIFEAFMYLHHPQTLQVQERLRSGGIGRILMIQGSFGFPLPAGAVNTRLVPQLGGGSLWDVGVYPVSFAITMAEAGPPVRVFGLQQSGETGVDVGFAGLLEFSGGISAQLSCSFRSPRHWGATVIGTESVLSIDEPWKPGFQETVSTVQISGQEGDAETLQFAAPDPYACEIATMEACVLDGVVPVVPLARSREILQTVLALYKSAASGQPESPRHL